MAELFRYTRPDGAAVVVDECAGWTPSGVIIVFESADRSSGEPGMRRLSAFLPDEDARRLLAALQDHYQRPGAGTA